MARSRQKTIHRKNIDESKFMIGIPDRSTERTHIISKYTRKRDPARVLFPVGLLGVLGVVRYLKVYDLLFLSLACIGDRCLDVTSVQRQCKLASTFS